MEPDLCVSPLKYSGFAEAMAYLAGQFGDSIPVIRGDGGPYWEDGIASTARSAALSAKTSSARRRRRNSRLSRAWLTPPASRFQDAQAALE